MANRYAGHPRVRILLGLGVVLATLLACGTTSVIAPHHKPSPTASVLAPCVKAPPPPALRLWARDTILVSLRSSTSDIGALGSGMTDAASALNAVLASAAPSGVTLSVDAASATLYPFGQTAVAAFTLQQTGTTLECLGLAVDAINRAAAATPPGIALAHSPGAWVLSAAPNWYTVASGLDYVGGSPSDPPTALRAATITPPTLTTSKPPAAAASIYVLDTGYAPDSASCPASSATCASLVSQLNAQLFANTVTDETTTSDRYRADHAIREHGVFIAAMLRHLAPTAPIQLVRVLDDFGVGDTSGLLAGLATVFKAGKAPSIVNLSLAVEPPLDCLITAWQYTYSAAGNGTQVYAPANCAPGQALKVDAAHAFQLLLLRPLGDPIMALQSAGFVLVAAAGNDSRAAAPQHLGADVPAAYCGVSAVAATTAPVGSAWQFSRDATAGLAAFSNLPAVRADGCVKLPGLEAGGTGLPMVAAGGATTTGHALVTEGTNLCSLFIHSQDYLSSATGAGAWSGTSFATAVISGNLAQSAAFSGRAPALVPGAPLAESLPCSSA